MLCMYVYMYVGMYVCVYVYMYVCVCMRQREIDHTHTSKYTLNELFNTRVGMQIRYKYKLLPHTRIDSKTVLGFSVCFLQRERSIK